ncbi:Uncharacterised protein [Enterobacter cloacae]|nr:Uncharacterised protein [Enterobacter cloacae]
MPISQVKAEKPNIDSATMPRIPFLAIKKPAGIWLKAYPKKNMLAMAPASKLLI